MDNVVNGDKKIESEIEEVMKKAIKSFKKEYKNEKTNKIDKTKLMFEIKEHIDFLSKLDEIDTLAEKHRIIFTDGNEQLLYSDGEFFLIDTLSSEKKKKMSKKQAKDAYIEYFITYQLNPLIEKKNMDKLKDSIDTLAEEKVSKEINKKDDSKIKNTKQKDEERKYKSKKMSHDKDEQER